MLKPLSMLMNNAFPLSPPREIHTRAVYKPPEQIRRPQTRYTQREEPHDPHVEQLPTARLAHARHAHAGYGMRNRVHDPPAKPLEYGPMHEIEREGYGCQVLYRARGQEPLDRGQLLACKDDLERGKYIPRRRSPVRIPYFTQ